MDATSLKKTPCFAMCFALRWRYVVYMIPSFCLEVLSPINIVLKMSFLAVGYSCLKFISLYYMFKPQAYFSKKVSDAILAQNIFKLECFQRSLYIKEKRNLPKTIFYDQEGKECDDAVKFVCFACCCVCLSVT
jgi:hypothetical protein